MIVVRILVLLVAAFHVVPAAASPSGSKAGKDELMTLYLMSIAADRCGFPMTSKQADGLDREVKALVDRMKLDPRENDAVYSDADIAFEKQGRAACDRNGDFAKGYRQTLQGLTGP